MQLSSSAKLITIAFMQCDFKVDNKSCFLADAAMQAAKLVRGAYMVLERQRAKDKKYESPIWEDKAHTDANFDR